ncbi:MAG: hypothetical protein RIR64_817 [Bacteroidota bacterium]
MHRIQLIFLLTGMFFAVNVSAQHISLVENKGEIGVMGGATFYRGDIATDILFYKPNFGVFYKKQINDYVGLRLNYEYISIGANDIQSNNFYEFKRGLYFTRTAHDVSLMGEFYFLKFINGNKSYRFTPYLGFGLGAWKSIKSTTNLDTATTIRTITYPLNLGFKYNLSGPWNIFGEATYRFTNSDKIDFFADNTHHVPPAFQYDIQASTSGNDQYFTAKLGVSYNLLSIYGVDKPKVPKKWLFFNARETRPSKPSKGLFSFLKRK